MFSLSFGLGALVLDHARAGCETCEGVPPALETAGTFGVRLTSWLALGVQGQAHVEFLTGDKRDDSRFGAFLGFVYGQLAIPPIFQVLGGVGYGAAQYQYTEPGLFDSVDRTASIGTGPATYVALRIKVARLRQVDLALETRITTLSVGSTGFEDGFTFNIVGGRF